MAIILLKANTNHPNASYQHTVTQVGAGNSDTIVFPPTMNVGVSMVLTVSSGSGKVQFSVTDFATLMDTTMTASVRWKDWPSGVVATTTDDRCLPVNALRIVTTSGTQVLEMAGR